MVVEARGAVELPDGVAAPLIEAGAVHVGAALGAAVDGGLEGGDGREADWAGFG